MAVAPHPTARAGTREIGMLVYDGVQSLDVTGPLEVFALASRQQQEAQPDAPPLYRVRLIGRATGTVTCACGIRFVVDAGCDEIATLDTLLVSGGMGDAVERAATDPVLLDWLRAMSGRVRRLGSICSGALLLAAAGLLDGRSATTHWRDIDALRRRHPLIRVVPDAIYTRDDPVWTSAGITAGIDLALAMISDDHGRRLSLEVAKRMVVVAKRAGGQSQFSRQLQALDAPDRFAELAHWIDAHLGERLDAERLSARVHMSPRQFGRRFGELFGATPQRYVEQLRLDAAKQQLENTDRPPARIAADCGFGSEQAMRRAFRRRLGLLPSEYRARFGA